MNVNDYLHLVPEIEKEIIDRRLDSLVIGMGPTGWLLRYVSRKILNDLRLWGCHDGCRIMPMDDLVVLDSPVNALHPDTHRHKYIVEARPKHIWIFKHAYPKWMKLLPEALHSITESVEWGVWQPGRTRHTDKFKLDATPPHTFAVSPTGMVTLAWREGCRRIGVIGADMMKGHHHTSKWGRIVDHFMVRCAERADELDGLVCNLSPISSLKEFRAWQSKSSSEATTGSKGPGPSASSNTASASTPANPSTSSGCEPVLQDGKSVPTEPAEPGS